MPAGVPFTSTVDTSAPAFQANAAVNRALVEALRARTAEIACGGSTEARERHAQRGKLLPRARIERLIDPGSPLLEIAPLAAYGLYEDEAPAAGLITAIGRISGRE